MPYALGQKVTVVANVTGTAQQFVGKVTKIERMNKDTVKYTITSKDGQEGWIYEDRPV
jgi:predicted ferric reductase